MAVKFLIFLLVLTYVQGMSLRRHDGRLLRRTEEPWICYDDEDCIGNETPHDATSLLKTEEPWNCFDDEDCTDNETPHDDTSFARFARTEEPWNCQDDEVCAEDETPSFSKLAVASDGQKDICGNFKRLKEQLNNYSDKKSDDSDPDSEKEYNNKVVNHFESGLSLDLEGFDKNCDYDRENCFRDVAENFDEGGNDDDDDDDDGYNDNDGKNVDDKDVRELNNQLSFEPHNIEVIAEDKPDFIYF